LGASEDRLPSTTCSAFVLSVIFDAMPPIAKLECSRCHKFISAQTPQTLCPDCSGSLYVRYDLRPLYGIAARDKIARQAAASPWAGMWRYSSVLPDVKPVTLGEGWTPMLPSRRFPNVFLKEEGANPTSTFKARGLALAVSMARHYGLKKLAVPSAGNAAGALAAYAAAAGIEAHIFMPKDVPFANYVEALHVLAGLPTCLLTFATEAFEADRSVVRNRPPWHKHVLLGHVPHTSQELAVTKRRRLDRTRVRIVQATK
jgi:hypothetical protein